MSSVWRARSRVDIWRSVSSSLPRTTILGNSFSHHENSILPVFSQSKEVSFCALRDVNTKEQDAVFPPRHNTKEALTSSVANLSSNSFQLIGAPQSSSSQQMHKRRCYVRGPDGNVKCGSSGKCHCSKRRKLRVKRSIKVPAISNKVADIPPMSIHGESTERKPIKGSPHPRYIYIIRNTPILSR
ncbi:hypothetical protein IFM89_025868, partial [Coptis chinensis]